MIAGAYLAGPTPAACDALLNAVFAGVGKDVVSRVWRKTKGDWDAWNARSLAEEPIVRLILDGTVARPIGAAIAGAGRRRRTLVLRGLALHEKRARITARRESISFCTGQNHSEKGFFFAMAAGADTQIG